MKLLNWSVIIKLFSSVNLDEIYWPNWNYHQFSLVFTETDQNPMKDLYEKQCLGKVIAYVYVIEFQKYDLSYTYILLILASENKLWSATDYDSIVSAKILNLTTHPLAYETVTNIMIYSPYSIMNPKVSYIKDVMCQKHYLKYF